MAEVRNDYLLAISSVQLIGHVRFLEPPQTAAHQASLSPTPWVCSNSCPSSRWCHPIISSSVVPFSSCPESRYFPMSQFFTSSGQSIEASASASVLPKNIQDWFPLALTGLISLQSKFWATQSMVLGKNPDFEDPQFGPCIHRSLVTKISGVKLQLPWTRWSQSCLLISGSQTIMLPMKQRQLRWSALVFM